MIQALQQHRMIAILRGIPLSQVVPTAKALYQGGVRMLEITFDQKNPKRCLETAQAILQVRDELQGNMLIGAGTVLTEEEAESAHRAGASFILSPNTDLAVITRTKELGMDSIPGAFTPSELVEAHRYGADVVKLFPAGDLGLGYIKAITAPLSHIPLLAVGGVSLENIGQFLTVAAGVGIGSNLADPKLAMAGEYEALTVRALEYTAASKTAPMEKKEKEA